MPDLSWPTMPPTVFAVAMQLARIYPLALVFDETVADGELVVNHQAQTIRVHPSAQGRVAGGPAGWKNFG
jgi:hypothetical protein